MWRGRVVIWFVLVLGLLLLVLGVWGGPKAVEESVSAEMPAVKEPFKGNPWDIITQPLYPEEELIKIPEHRPWYLPGRDRRFARGLLVGLGAGLMTASMLAAGLSPSSKQAVASNQPPNVTVPATSSAPKEEQKPAATANEPAKPAETKQEQPADVAFEIAAGDLPETIAGKLKGAGLIPDEQQFLTRIAERGVDTQLRAGSYTVPTQATLDQVIEALLAGA